jgi:alkylhydroperoxidase family enzyme
MKARTAMLPRLPPLDPPYEPAVAAEFERFMPRDTAPLKLFRTVAHNPRVLQRFFAGGLLDRGALSLRQREIVILRATARCGAAYEWGVHVAYFAAKAGLGEAELQATVHGDATAPVWPAAEASLIRLVDELHATATVSDALYAELAGHYAPAALVELIVLAGLYHMVSFVTNAFAVEAEAWASAFPGAAALRSSAP